MQCIVIDVPDNVARQSNAREVRMLYRQLIVLRSLGWVRYTSYLYDQSATRFSLIKHFQEKS